MVKELNEYIGKARKVDGVEIKKYGILSWADNWIDLIVDGHFCQAKVYSEPSKFGIDGGRVSKLAISKVDTWEGFDKCIYNYDRGLDFSNNRGKAIIKKIQEMFFVENA